MSFAAPSIARPYGLISSLDPALDAPERTPEETDDAWKGRLDSWTEQLRVARERDDWKPLLKAGETPTVFRCRHIPGDIWAMRARVLAGMGQVEYMAHVVRLALVGIENFRPDFKLKLVPHLDLDGKPTGFGKVADPAVVGELAALTDADGNPVGETLITELGALVITRQMGAPSGK